MTDDQSESQDSPGLIGGLLSGLRAPERVVTDIATIASTLLALRDDVQGRLASIDENADALRQGVGELRTPLDRIDRKVAELETIEEAITARMDTIHSDLNARLLSLEEEVRAMRSPVEQMARDLSGVKQLLPEPGDGPMARLKDTFSPS